MIEYMKILRLQSLLFCSVLALADKTELGVSFENDRQETALLKLDYATYRGYYNSSSDVVSASHLPGVLF